MGTSIRINVIFVNIEFVLFLENKKINFTRCLEIIIKFKYYQ